MGDAVTICLVATSALADVLNPSILGVFIFAVAAILGGGKSAKHMVALGSAFIAAFFMVHLGLGLAWVYLIGNAPSVVGQFVTIAIAFAVVFAGLLGIKDYFWYGKSISLHFPVRPTRRLQKWATAHLTMVGMTVLGGIAASLGLLITGAPYLAVATIVGTSAQAIGMVLLYNVIFILPLGAIVTLAAGRIRIHTFQKWQEQHKAAIRLAAGLVCIGLGWLLLLTANGAITLG